MKRNLTGRVIPAALALALAAAPVTSFAKTKAVEATGVADENGFVSQPGNEYDDATMKKLADNMLPCRPLRLRKASQMPRRLSVSALRPGT